MAEECGLVLEGGGMRVMFTCGVLDVLMEEGVSFAAAVGVSAGATFGCNLKSGQIGRAIRYNKRFCRDSHYGSFRSFLRTGNVYDTDFCYHRLPEQLDVFDNQAFLHNPMRFYVCATDMLSGQSVYHLCTDGGAADIDWFRASGSLPILSHPVPIDGRLYLDGGVADSVPLSFMQGLGYTKNVLILTRPYGARLRKSRALPLVRVHFRRYPALVRQVATRHTQYNACMEEIERQEAEKKIFVIRPSAPLDVPLMGSNPNTLERIYQMGRSTAQSLLPALQAYLGKV